MLGSVWSVLGEASVVVAALAALVTVFFARSTVQEARQARLESRRAHEEEMAAQAEELATELRLRRIKRLEVVAEVLVDLVRAARNEHIEPSPEVSPPMPFRLTLIPTLLSRLGAAIAILSSTDGPDLPKAHELVDQGYGVGTPPLRIVSNGIDALREVEAAVRTVA